MLTEESREISGHEQTSKTGFSTINIGNEPVMQTALDVLSFFGTSTGVTLKAKGNSIPNAVAVANIITEKMLCGNSKVKKITLDTDEAPGIGKMLSTIEIILYKT